MQQTKGGMQMLCNNEIQEIKTICEKLTPQNLMYVKAVTDALKFAEDSTKKAIISSIKLHEQGELHRILK